MQRPCIADERALTSLGCLIPHISSNAPFSLSPSTRKPLWHEKRTLEASCDGKNKKHTSRSSGKNDKEKMTAAGKGHTTAQQPREDELRSTDPHYCSASRDSSPTASDIALITFFRRLLAIMVETKDSIYDIDTPVAHAVHIDEVIPDEVSAVPVLEDEPNLRGPAGIGSAVIGM